MSRRKSVKLHKAQGTYEPGRHDNLASGVGFDGNPKRPSHVQGEARKMWNRVVPKLVKAGYVSRLDAENLAAMCHWYAMWLSLADNVDGIYAAKAAWVEFSKIAHDYGLDPVSRQKINIPEKPKTDPLLAMYDTSAG